MFTATENTNVSSNCGGSSPKNLGEALTQTAQENKHAKTKYKSK